MKIQIEKTAQGWDVAISARVGRHENGSFLVDIDERDEEGLAPILKKYVDAEEDAMLTARETNTARRAVPMKILRARALLEREPVCRKNAEDWIKDQIPEWLSGTLMENLVLASEHITKNRNRDTRTTGGTIKLIRSYSDGGI